jgi:hypothetical protein
MSDGQHWAITLYRRYVELYGEPIEQDIRASTSRSAEDKCQNPTK